MTREQAVEVTDSPSEAEGFTATSDDGDHETDYAVLVAGANRELAERLGCGFDGDVCDVTMETSVDNAYATGAMARAEQWQAAIPAGEGASAALNILTRERGEHFHDFDVPADARATFGDD